MISRGIPIRKLTRKDLRSRSPIFVVNPVAQTEEELLGDLLDPEKDVVSPQARDILLSANLSVPKGEPALSFRRLTVSEVVGISATKKATTTEIVAALSKLGILPAPQYSVVLVRQAYTDQPADEWSMVYTAPFYGKLEGDEGALSPFLFDVIARTGDEGVSPGGNPGIQERLHVCHAKPDTPWCGDTHILVSC